MGGGGGLLPLQGESKGGVYSQSVTLSYGQSGLSGRIPDVVYFFSKIGTIQLSTFSEYCQLSFPDFG